MTGTRSPHSPTGSGALCVVQLLCIGNGGVENVFSCGCT